jgi:polyisoprenoid-binding protein YceI
MLRLAIIINILFSFAYAKNYKINTKNSKVGFSVTKFKINGDVPGSFKKFSGQFDFDAKKTELKNIKVEIETASVDTGKPKRDKHLRDDPEFFLVKKYPKIIFETAKDRVFKLKEGIVTFVKGKLTIKDKTREETLNVIYNGIGKKGPKFSILSQIDRRNYNVTWNDKYEGEVLKRFKRKFFNKILDNNVKIQIFINQ